MVTIPGAGGKTGMRAAALLFARNFRGHSVVEFFGQRISYRKIAEIIGDKTGVPDLPYIEAPDEDVIQSMTAAGMSRSVAESYVELAGAINRGEVTTKKLDPMSPNAPTRYCDFVDGVFYPLYRKAA